MPSVCRIDGCEKRATGNGLCHTHYCRQWRYGTTELTRKPSELSLERFEVCIERVPESGCWLWTKQVQPSGHGRVRVGDKKMLAHRAVWEASNGPLPKDSFLLHRCNVPSCVNPAHLYIGTIKDNVQDCIRAGNFKGKDNLLRHAHRGRA